MEVEYEVELADAPEVLVEHLHEDVDELQYTKFIIGLVYAQREEQPRIPPVDDLVVPELEEVCHLGVPGNYLSMGLGLDAAPLFVVIRDIPPAETCLPLAILEQHEANLGIKRERSGMRYLEYTYHILRIIYYSK